MVVLLNSVDLDYFFFFFNLSIGNGSISYFCVSSVIETIHRLLPYDYIHSMFWLVG